MRRPFLATIYRFCHITEVNAATNQSFTSYYLPFGLILPLLVNPSNLSSALSASFSSFPLNSLFSKSSILSSTKSPAFFTFLGAFFAAGFAAFFAAGFFLATAFVVFFAAGLAFFATPLVAFFAAGFAFLTAFLVVFLAAGFAAFLAAGLLFLAIFFGFKNLKINLQTKNTKTFYSLSKLLLTDNHIYYINPIIISLESSYVTRAL